MNLRQLFCKHAYRTLDIEVLSITEKEILGVPVSRTYNELITERCVFCKKDKHHTQKRTMDKSASDFLDEYKALK